jgi:phosphoenolpyruvate-protein phosphotransferase (PTS system enzyme I)
MAAKPEKIYRGNGVSPGVVLGQALKFESHSRLLLKVHVDDVEEEGRRYLRAIEASKEQLRALKSQLEEKVGSEHGIILDAHLLMLEDRSLNAEILENIRISHANAEWVLMQATDRLVHAYQSLEDEYFRERHSDIEHVADRIQLNLSGDRPFSWEHLSGNQIIVSRDFSPSDFATMDLEKVRGLVLESGGRTSHTSIICRGLSLPAVMGLRDFLDDIATGDTLLLNGDDGHVIVNPTPARIETVRRRMEAFGAFPADSSPAQFGTPAMTKDGVAISLRANTEMMHELSAAKNCGAAGIGLFRSEFLYFRHPQGYPGMEEQLVVYRRLTREMSPYPVAIRTLDAGSEKVGGSPDPTQQENPSMGLRGIRLSLYSKEAFLTQIEAIFRASCDGRIEIVLPMISTIEEIWQAKVLIDQVRSKVREAVGPAIQAVPVGAMIEVPAAVFSLEVLAKEVDFLCVGTNDLIQYMLAVDRGNPHVAYLFQPLHPTVLHCLNRISKVANSLNKPVRICGEISSNPFYAVLLLGMGFTQLSMNPLSIPTIRSVLREIPMEASRQIAQKALTFITAREVYEYLTHAVAQLVSWDISSYAKEIAPQNGRNEK